MIHSAGRSCDSVVHSVSGKVAPGSHGRGSSEKKAGVRFRKARATRIFFGGVLSRIA